MTKVTLPSNCCNCNSLSNYSKYGKYGNYNDYKLLFKISVYPPYCDKMRLVVNAVSSNYSGNTYYSYYSNYSDYS